MSRLGSAGAQQVQGAPADTKTPEEKQGTEARRGIYKSGGESLKELLPQSLWGGRMLDRASC